MNINTGTTFKSVVEVYNNVAVVNNWDNYTDTSSSLTVNCTIAGFLNKTYGKYENIDIENTIIMEYGNFLPFLVPFLSNTSNT